MASCSATLARALPRRICSGRSLTATSLSYGQGRRAFAAGFGQFGFGGPGGFPGQGPAGGDDRLYQLLEVDRNADEAAIKQAYKKQAMKHHPDRGGDEAKFKDISKAYEVLSDPQKRQIYDAYGEEGLEGAGADAGGGPGTNPFDLFSHIFGFQAGNQQRRGRPVTENASYEVELSLEELYAGTSRSIRYERNKICTACNGQGGKNPQKCQRCNGTGVVLTMRPLGPGMVQQSQSVCSSCGGRGIQILPKDVCTSCRGAGTVKEKTTFDIKIEPGEQDGREFRFRGASDEAPGHDPGDLIIKVREKTHPLFQRVEDSLVMVRKISLAEALCGFTFTTKFLDGENLIVSSEPGKVMKPGDLLVIPGKGMPRKDPTKQGNLFVQIQVDFPQEMPEKSRHGLAELLGGKVPEEDPNGEVAKKLSAQQEQRVKESWRQHAERRKEQEATQCAMQ